MFCALRSGLSPERRALAEGLLGGPLAGRELRKGRWERILVACCAMPLSLQQLGSLQHASLPARGGYVQDSPYRAPPCVVFCPSSSHSFLHSILLSLFVYLCLCLSLHLSFYSSFYLCFYLVSPSPSHFLSLSLSKNCHSRFTCSFIPLSLYSLSLSLSLCFFYLFLFCSLSLCLNPNQQMHLSNGQGWLSLKAYVELPL